MRKFNDNYWTIDTIDELLRMIVEFNEKESVESFEVVNYVDRKKLVRNALFIKWLSWKTGVDVLHLIGSFRQLDLAIFENW